MFPLAETYAIRAAERLDVPAINALLEKYYYPEETTLECLLSRRVVDADELSEIAEDRRRIVEAMVVNFPCLVAVHAPSNEIVGVNLTIVSENRGPKTKWSKLKSTIARCCEDDPRRSYVECAPRSSLLAERHRRSSEMIDEAKLHSRFPGVKSRLQFRDVAVSEDHRGRGLATALLTEGIKVAWDSRLDFVFGLFATTIARSAATRAGMTTCHAYDLTNYRRDDGGSTNSVPRRLVEMKVADAALGSSTRGAALQLARLLIRESAGAGGRRE